MLLALVAMPCLVWGLMIHEPQRTEPRAPEPRRRRHPHGYGFASVYIARQEVVSPGSLTYAAFFFGVYLVAHLVRA